MALTAAKVWLRALVGLGALRMNRFNPYEGWSGLGFMFEGLRAM